MSKKECWTFFSYENVFFCCNIFVIHALVWRLSFVASVATYTSAHEEFEWALCRKPYEYEFALFLGSRRSWLGYKGCCTGGFWGSCFLSFSFLSSLFWRLDFFGGWPPWLPGPPWPPAPPLTAFIFFGMTNSENGRGDFIIIIRTGGSYPHISHLTSHMLRWVFVTAWFWLVGCFWQIRNFHNVIVLRDMFRFEPESFQKVGRRRSNWCL